MNLADSDDMSLDFTLEIVKHEVNTAMKKFPPFHSAHEGFAILKEEVDELWTEIKANNRYNMLNECIQVAAMAVRFLVDIKTQEQVDNARGEDHIASPWD